MNVEDKIYRERLLLASILERFLAYLIDYFLISFVFVGIFWEQIAPLQQNYSAIINFVQEHFFYFVSLNLTYEFLFVFLYGATLGKMILKIKVISLGMLDRPSLIYSAIRALSKVMAEFLFYAPFFVVFFSPVHQALHDILGKTLVIKNA